MLLSRLRRRAGVGIRGGAGAGLSPDPISTRARPVLPGEPRAACSRSSTSSTTTRRAPPSCRRYTSTPALAV